MSTETGPLSDIHGPIASESSIWEVWQGMTLICSAQMRLSEREAKNKVENERRLGYRMEARPAREKRS